MINGDDMRRYNIKIMNVNIAKGDNTYTECEKDRQRKTILVDLYLSEQDFMKFAGENSETLDYLSGEELEEAKNKIKNTKIGIIKDENNKYSFIFNEYEFYLPSNWDGGECILVPKEKVSFSIGTQKKDKYQLKRVNNINIKPNNVKKNKNSETQTENDYQVNKVNNINRKLNHRKIKSVNIFGDKKINTKFNDIKQSENKNIQAKKQNIFSLPKKVKIELGINSKNKKKTSVNKKHKFSFKSIYDYESDNEKINKILAKFTLNNKNKKEPKK